MTCSSRGIGFACAKALAEAGASIAICARSNDPLQAAACAIGESSGARVVAKVANLGVPADVRRFAREAIDALGAIDILVFNQPHPISGKDFGHLQLLEFEQIFREGVLAAVTLCQELVPAMRRNSWGRLVFLNSISAKEPSPEYIISSAVRPGLLGLAKCLASIYAVDGITSNSILMGYFDTDLLRQLLAAKSARDGVDVGKLLAGMGGSIPRHRIGQPEEVAALVVALCGTALGYVNGSAIPCDGGVIKQLF